MEVRGSTDGINDADLDFRRNASKPHGRVMRKAPAELPAQPAGATNPAGLVRQQRDRKRALRRVAKLRKRASDEIDRLLAFLDASDPYAATEMEDAVDDHPCDTDELEPSLCGIHVGQKNLSADDLDLELEHDGREPGENDEDGADNEPSLCGVTANGDTSGDADLEYDVAFDTIGSTPPGALKAARARDKRKRSNVRLPDGRPVDLASIPSNVTIIAG